MLEKSTDVSANETDVSSVESVEVRVDEFLLSLSLLKCGILTSSTIISTRNLSGLLLKMTCGGNVEKTGLNVDKCFNSKECVNA